MSTPKLTMRAARSMLDGVAVLIDFPDFPLHTGTGHINSETNTSNARYYSALVPHDSAESLKLNNSNHQLGCFKNAYGFRSDKRRDRFRRPSRQGTKVGSPGQRGLHGLRSIRHRSKGLR